MGWQERVAYVVVSNDIDDFTGTWIIPLPGKFTNDNLFLLKVASKVGGDMRYAYMLLANCSEHWALVKRLVRAEFYVKEL